MERREWGYRYVKGVGYVVESFTGMTIIATARDEPTAKTIITDHNQHAHLIKQKDRLAQAVRDLRYRHRLKAKTVNFDDCGCDDCLFLQPHLNAIDAEQADESQAGGEGEG